MYKIQPQPSDVIPIVDSFKNYVLCYGCPDEIDFSALNRNDEYSIVNWLIQNRYFIKSAVINIPETAKLMNYWIEHLQNSAIVSLRSYSLIKFTKRNMSYFKSVDFMDRIVVGKEIQALVSKSEYDEYFNIAKYNNEFHLLSVDRVAKYSGYSDTKVMNIGFNRELKMVRRMVNSQATTMVDIRTITNKTLSKLLRDALLTELKNDIFNKIQQISKIEEMCSE